MILKNHKMKPVRGALPPKQIRKSTNFKNQINEAKSTERMYSIAVDDVISTTAASLPVEFLIKHKMFKYVQRIAIGKLQIIFNIIRLKILRRGYNIWTLFCKQMHTIQKMNAANKINGAVRIHLAVKKRKKLETAKLVGESVAKDLALKSKDDYMKAIITLQSFGRMTIMRQRYLIYFPACHIAAYCIQKQYRLHVRLKKGGMLLFEAVQIMQQRAKATATLQRVYRGFLGRLRARLMYTVRHRVTEQLKYETRDGIFRVYFEQHGAALRLQRWAWAMGWPLNARIKRRQKMREKILKGKALVIQRAYRGYLGRKVAKVLYAAKQKQLLEIRKVVAVVKIQALVRGFIRRQRSKDESLNKKKDVVSYLSRLNRDVKRKRKESRRDVFIKPVREYNRRGGFSFEHLRIGDDQRIRLMGQCARRIQVAWKSQRVRKHFRRVLSIRRLICARRIMRGMQRFVLRRQLGRVLYRIIPFIRLRTRRLRRRRDAACQIQKCYRGFMTRRHLRIRFGAGRCVLRFLLRMTAHFQRREKLHYRRMLEEQNSAGREFFYRTLEYRRIEEFWKGSQRKGKSHHELKSIFATLAPNGLAESGRLIKLLKSVPDLLDKHFDAKEVEILFAKMRKHPEKRLTYPQFLDLLYEMACSKFMHMRTEKKSNRSARSSSPTTKSQTFSSQWLGRQRESLAQQQRASAVVNRDRDRDLLEEEEDVVVDDLEFEYGRLRNRAALVVCFVDLYLAPTKAYRECVSNLQNNSSLNIATRIVNLAVKRLQRFCRNRLIAKHTWKLGLSLQSEYQEFRKLLAAKNVQRVYRGWNGRRRAVTFAQQMYVKCVDPDSGYPYWFSSVSEQSFWEKPFLLREFDCGEAVMMPPLEEMCTTACQNDNCARSATTYCSDCDGLLCVTCSHIIHNEGRRKTHEIIKLTQCAQCGFQLATRHCKSCGDFYCDSCFSWVHRKGRMKLHTGAWVTDRCDICEMRAAWWAKQDPEHNYKATVYCRLCFPQVFGYESEPSEIENIFPVQYTGPAVQHYYLQRRLQEEKKFAEAKLLEMRKSDFVKKRILSATHIQRLFRGHVARKNMAAWLTQRREQLLRRQQDEKERNSLSHRLMVAMGIGKSLPSDTAMEYTMRLFPWYMKPTIEDCVGRDWSMAASLAGWQQERHPMTTAEGLRAWSRLRSVESSERRLKRRLEMKMQQSEEAKQDYIKARATSASHLVIREMKSRSETAEVEVGTAKDELEKIEKDCLAAREEWLEFKDGVSGPLKRLVREQRKNGIALDITGRLVRGSPALRIKKADEKRWIARTRPKSFLVLEGSVYRLVSGEILSAAVADTPTTAPADDETLPGDSVEGAVQGEHTDDAFVQPNSAQERLSAPEAVVNNADEFCVLLDRDWPLPSQSDVPLCRLVVQPPHTAVAFQIRRGLQLSYPVQMGLRGIVHTLHGLSQTCLSSADKFDDEGSMARRFRTLAKDLERRRDKTLKSCSKPVNLKNMQKKPHVTMYGRFNQVVGSVQTKLRELEAKRQQRKAIEAMPAYYRWEQSTTKMQIECVLDLDDGTKPKSIGTFEMDPDANCVVMREYIERAFRLKLNENIGEDFCFTKVAGSGDGLLLREDEPKTWASDYLSVKGAPPVSADEEIEIDFAKEAEMLKLPHVVMIIRDRGVIGTGPASLIPEFPPYEVPTATDTV